MAAAPPQVVREWVFDRDGEMLGWSAGGHIQQAHVEGGALRGNGPLVRIDASQVRTLAIRMRSNRATEAQIFWGRTTLPQSETTSVRFSVSGDGQWHEHRFDLGKNAAWRGVMVSLRFDPASHGDTEFAVDYLRLE